MQWMVTKTNRQTNYVLEIYHWCDLHRAPVISDKVNDCTTSLWASGCHLLLSIKITAARPVLFSILYWHTKNKQNHKLIAVRKWCSFNGMYCVICNVCMRLTLFILVCQLVTERIVKYSIIAPYKNFKKRYRIIYRYKHLLLWYSQCVRPVFMGENTYMMYSTHSQISLQQKVVTHFIQVIKYNDMYALLHLKHLRFTRIKL